MQRISENAGVENIDRLIGMLNRSRNRRKILKTIKASDKSLGSREISQKIGLNQSTIIKILNDLDLANALEEVAKVRRGRMYRITEKGLAALEKVEK